MWRLFVSIVKPLLLVIVLIVGGTLPGLSLSDDLPGARCNAESFLLIDVTFDTSNVLRDDIKYHLALPLLERFCYVSIQKTHFSVHLVLLLQCVDGGSAG
jgi:hypothetical protein